MREEWPKTLMDAGFSREAPVVQEETCYMKAQAVSWLAVGAIIIILLIGLMILS